MALARHNDVESTQHRSNTPHIKYNSKHRDLNQPTINLQQKGSLQIENGGLPKQRKPIRASEMNKACNKPGGWKPEMGELQDGNKMMCHGI